MEPIEIREMQYVLILSKTKSFSHAAKRCFISQPALSKIIKKVEQSLGMKIFDRGTSPLEVTTEGKNILEYFSKMLALESSLERYSTSVLEQQKTDLIIGASTYFCTFIFPELIAAYKLENPNCNIRVIEANPHDLYTLIESGAMDLGLAVESSILEPLNYLLVKKEMIILAVPKHLDINKRLDGYALSSQALLDNELNSTKYPSVPLKYFEHEKFIFLKEGNDLHQRGLKMCRDAGFKPNISMEMDQLLSAYTLAASGVGITFIRAGLPHYMSNLNEHLLYYKIDHPDIMRKLMVFTKSNNTLCPLQEKFVKFMKDYFFPS